MHLLNELSAKVPNLCHLAPAGPHHIEELDRAGGIPAVMQELTQRNLLDLSLITATGKTVGENTTGVTNRNPEVVRPIDHPYSETGGIAVLWGNLAEHGCVVKRSAVAPEMMVHSGPARVFDSEDTAIAAIYGGEIHKGDVVIIRYEGPKGGPGMREMLNPTSALAGMKLNTVHRADNRWTFSAHLAALPLDMYHRKLLLEVILRLYRKAIASKLIYRTAVYIWRSL